LSQSVMPSLIVSDVSGKFYFGYLLSIGYDC
jgi:hypothetical protein